MSENDNLMIYRSQRFNNNKPVTYPLLHAVMATSTFRFTEEDGVFSFS